MPRNATATFVQALAKGYLYPVQYVEIYFASGPVRMCTAYHDQILAGVLYKALGPVLEISTIEDGSTVMARGVTVTLGGIDASLVKYALDDFQVGLPATITLGLLGDQTNNLPINAPVVAWSGRTDQPTITISEKTASISIALESALLDMNTPLPYRYTNQTQVQFYPKDRAFKFVNNIQNLPCYWGSVENNNGTV